MSGSSSGDPDIDLGQAVPGSRVALGPLIAFFHWSAQPPMRARVPPAGSRELRVCAWGNHSVTEAKKLKEMRDIRSDLQDRANRIRQQLRAEQAQFEILTAQLKREQSNRLEDLRAHLQAVTSLLQFASWHHDVRMAVARALALAATAEIAARQFSQAQNRSVVGRPSG